MSKKQLTPRGQQIAEREMELMILCAGMGWSPDVTLLLAAKVFVSDLETKLKGTDIKPMSEVLPELAAGWHTVAELVEDAPAKVADVPPTWVPGPTMMQ